MNLLKKIVLSLSILFLPLFGFGQNDILTYPSGIVRFQDASTQTSSTIKGIFNDIDFTNNLWLDESIYNNDASLIGGNCLAIHNDILLTLDTKYIGATVTSVNDGATTGVSVDVSGNIAIDYSLLPDTLLYSVVLDNGKEFRFTTGDGKFIFTLNNWGSLGGTEDVTWSWSTRNDAHLNLQYGFTRLPYAYNQAVTRSIFDNNPIPLKSDERWSVYWEGYPLGNKSVLFSISQNPGYTWGYALVADKANAYLKWTVRTAGYATIIDTLNAGDLDGWLSVELLYNGGGFGDGTNFTMILNGDTLDSWIGVNSLEGRSLRNTWYHNNGNLNDYAVVRELKYTLNDFYEIYCIKNGEVFEYNMRDNPDKFLYIPVFSGVDAFGQIPTNPSYSDAHNGAETKIIFPKGVTDFDYSDILSDTVNVGQLYSKYNNKIWIDNSINNKYNNLIVLSESDDYTIETNNFMGYVPKLTFRSDNAGALDPDVPLFPDLVSEQNARAEIHYTNGYSTNTKLDGLFTGDTLSGALHDFPPAFWNFSDSAHGYQAFLRASVGDQTDSTAMALQGMIGYAPSTTNKTSMAVIKILNGYGYAYPGGIPPDSSDNNSKWWSWAVDTWSTHSSVLNTKVNQFSYLGTLPTGGINARLHRDSYKLLTNSYYKYKFFNNDTISLVDSLSISKTVFNGDSNTSVTTFLGDDVQLMSGNGDVSYGNIDLGNNEYLLAPCHHIEMKVRANTGTIAPLSSIQYNYYNDDINFTATEINYFGDVYTNPMSVNNWYIIRFNKVFDYINMEIYDSIENCILYIPYMAISNTARGVFKLNSDGIDSYVKDISIYADWRKSFYLQNYSNKGRFIGNWTIGETADQQADTIIYDLIDDIYTSNNVGRPFTHYVKDPAVKAPDGTEAGLIDRSYDLWTKVFDSINSYQWDWTNITELRELDPLSTDRVNYVYNTNLDTLVNNHVKKNNGIWGFESFIYDETETLNNSTDGTPVVKLASAALQNVFFDPTEGLHYIKFWMKGDIQIFIDDNIFKEYNVAENRIIANDYTFYNIPIYVNNYTSGRWRIRFLANSDTYFHKLLIE